ncbi:MAG: ATP-binding protein [Spirochaetota bacterium]
MKSYSLNSQRLFHNIFARLHQYHDFMQIKPALLAYSGGKDSTILLHFYAFLFQQDLIPKPAVFHMNHMIRENYQQEESILNYLQQEFSFLLFAKKKIFLGFPFA